MVSVGTVNPGNRDDYRRTCYAVSVFGMAVALVASHPSTGLTNGSTRRMPRAGLVGACHVARAAYAG